MNRKISPTDKIRISAISYLNSLPFIYGIENYLPLQSSYTIEKDIPSQCAAKLANNFADIGLIPVAAISSIAENYIVSDFCIGAVGKVDTVLLLSDVKIEHIKEIFLDYQSRTSVKLVQVLAKKYWNINPVFTNAEQGYENKISGTSAGVIIGDRTFQQNKNYAFTYDLAEEWYKMTSLPFVFACWVSNKKLSDSFINNFNNACAYGLQNIEEVIKTYSHQNIISSQRLRLYFSESISYNLDSEKNKGMNLFLKYLEEL